MIFSELYSAYYHTVAKILSLALTTELSEKEICKQIEENAFSESVLTILPALRGQRWQLLNQNLSPVLRHAPAMPLTLLEKQWLKAILSDARIRLFDVSIDGLEDVPPLFTGADYKIYDRYADGDPYEDERYIRNFRLVREAIRAKRPLWAWMENRKGKEMTVRFFPQRLEYSEKDDKFRVIATGCRHAQFNLGRIKSCAFYNGNDPWIERTQKDPLREVVLHVTDERNALERVMLHFAHFEKQAERLDAKHYIVRLRYYESDETEIVIRILSFGPFVKVTAPDSFVNLIKERLIRQKSCGLR